MIVLALAAALFAQRAPNPPADARRDELERFRAALADLKHGDATARERLSASAESLCTEFARCDARDVARYYLELSPAALAEGDAIEKSLLDVREAVDLFAKTELDAAEWAARRGEMLAKLDELATRGATLSDYVPAARVESFAARLRVERLERDPTLDDSGRAELAAAADRDIARCLAALERAGQIGPSLEPRWLAGRVARWRGKRGEAKRDFERCLADAEHVDNDDFREHALRGLVTLARDTGDSGEEERLLLEMARFRSPKDCWPLARDWGSWLVLADHAERALDFLERNAPSGADATDGSEWDLLTGAAAMRVRDFARARTHLERAASLGASDSALLALTRLALSEGRTGEVFERLENGLVLETLPPIEQAEALSLRGEAHLAVEEFDLARESLGQALATADAWDAALAADPLDASERAVRNVVGEWLGVHTVAAYALAAARDGDPLEAARAIEEFQSRSLRRGARELGKLHALVGVQDAALTRDDLAAWAKSSELGLVTWVLGPDFGVAVHVSPDGTASFARVDRTRAEIDDGARRLREALIASDGGAIDELSRSLGAALFPPSVRDSIAKSTQPSARLLVLLHGPLEALPIELVALGERSLDSHCTVICAPGLATKTPRPNTNAQSHWNFVGAPSGSPLGELAGAKDELEALHASDSGSKLALGSAFDRNALAAAFADGGSLHVATHLAPASTSKDGRAAADRSRFAAWGLALANGDVFSADEIRDQAPPLECVVLSSCASGGGRWLDAEGLQGLARAFLETGTRNVVATLWPIRDRAARDFALALHRHLGAGEPVSRAVRAARAELRAGGAKPADWAAFRLLGRD